MKTFNDLQFKPKPIGGIGARHKFDNGFTISVQAGSFAYSTPRENKENVDDFSEFEIAILNDDGEFVTKDFLPGHYDDVLGWQNRGQINALMLLIQSKK